METLTIVCIIEHLSTGGEEMLVTELMPALKESGIRPVVITFMPGKLDNKLLKTGVALVTIPTSSKLRRLVQLIKVIKSIKPDIVHTRLFSGGTWGRIAALSAKVPVIVHTHGGYTFREKKLKRFPIERILFYLTDATVAVSNGVKNHLKTAAGIKGKSVIVIYNGLHLSGFTRLPIKKMDVPVRFICVGRLEHVKGQDIAIRAVSRLPENMWQELLLAGEGSERYQLQKLAELNNISHKVHFLGNRKDIPNLLASADIFISPSRSEGLPISVLEAMAAGCPVIATDISGHREAVGHTGVLVPPETPEEMAQGIISMIRSGERAEQMANAARERVISKFDFQKMRDAHVSLYRKLVKR